MTILTKETKLLVKRSIILGVAFLFVFSYMTPALQINALETTTSVAAPGSVVYNLDGVPELLDSDDYRIDFPYTWGSESTSGNYIEYRWPTNKVADHPRLEQVKFEFEYRHSEVDLGMPHGANLMFKREGDDWTNPIVIDVWRDDADMDHFIQVDLMPLFGEIDPTFAVRFELFGTSTERAPIQTSHDKARVLPWYHPEEPGLTNPSGDSVHIDSVAIDESLIIEGMGEPRAWAHLYVDGSDTGIQTKVDGGKNYQFTNADLEIAGLVKGGNYSGKDIQVTLTNTWGESESSRAIHFSRNVEGFAPETPEDIGWNVPPGDYGQRPVDIPCGGYTNQNSVAHNWTDESASGAAEYHRQWMYPGGSTWHGSEIWGTPYTNYRTFGGSTGTEGLWHVRVRSGDGQGNWSGWSDGSCTITYDVTAPIVQITNPADGAMLFGNVNITGEIIEDNLSHYNLSLTPGHDFDDTWDFSKRVWQVQQGENNPSHWLDTTTLPDGDYMIRLAARDKAGNRDPMPSVGTGVSVHVIYVTIDNNPPDAPTLIAPAHESESDATDVIFNWSDVDGAVEYKLWVDGTEYLTTESEKLMTLSDGIYTWKAKARDTAGHWSDWSDTWTLNVSTTTDPVEEPDEDDGGDTDGSDSSGNDGGTGDDTGNEGAILGVVDEGGAVTPVAAFDSNIGGIGGPGTLADLDDATKDKKKKKKKDDEGGVLGAIDETDDDTGIEAEAGSFWDSLKGLMKKWWFWLIVAAIIIFLLWILGRKREEKDNMSINKKLN